MIAFVLPAMIDREEQRRFALFVAEKLCSAGHVAYWAGGCVRDQLLGLRPNDYDVATDATPEAIRALFGRRKTIAIGEAFGVITVLGNRCAGSVEVATFRSDANYTDGRRPDAIKFSSPEEDANRRDFPINGLFFDPTSSRVIDFVGGQEDLQRRIVKAIGDPADRIAEDKLRMLRAVRFAAAFDFVLDRSTADAIRDHAAEISIVSAERIGAEVERMLIDKNRARALELLADVDLLQHVLPEMSALRDRAGGADRPTQRETNQWRKTLAVCDNLQAPSLPLALAAGLHRVAQPRAAIRVARRLKFSNKTTEQSQWLLDHLPIVENAQRVTWPILQRVVIHDGIGELLSLRMAIAGPDDPSVLFCQERLTLPREKLNPEPFLTGNDLIAHGLEPGPRFAALLRRVRDAQLEGTVHSTAEALEFVDSILAERDAGETGST